MHNLDFDNDFRRFMDAVLLGNDLVIVGAQYRCARPEALSR